jgi:gas vesicle protein
MEAIKRVFKFGMGGALGAAIGAGVASLFAPQKGEELQTASRSFVTEVKTAGDIAQQETEARLAQRFRVQVADDKALTGDTEHRAPRLV